MELGSNKSRKDTRAVVSLVARYRSPSTFEFVQEACCDVSLGGMFIQSQDPAPAGTLLKLECGADHETAKIRGVARVVWLRREPNEYGPRGMGVKFVKLEPGSKEAITRVVQELAAAGVTPASISTAPESSQQARASQSEGAGLIARGSKQIATWVPGPGAKPLVSSSTRLAQAHDRSGYHPDDDANAGPGLSVSQVRSVSSRPPRAPAAGQSADELAAARKRITWVTGGAVCVALLVVIGFATRSEKPEATARPENAADKSATASNRGPSPADAPAVTAQAPQPGDGTTQAAANSALPSDNPAPPATDAKEARPAAANDSAASPAEAPVAAGAPRPGASATAPSSASVGTTERETHEAPAITIAPARESPDLHEKAEGSPSHPQPTAAPEHASAAAAEAARLNGAEPGANAAHGAATIATSVAAQSAPTPAATRSPASQAADPQPSSAGPATAPASQPTPAAASSAQPAAPAHPAASSQPAATHPGVAPASSQPAATHPGASPASGQAAPTHSNAPASGAQPAASPAAPATAAKPNAAASTTAAAPKLAAANASSPAAPAQTTAAHATAAAPAQSAAAHAAANAAAPQSAATHATANAATAQGTGAHVSVNAAPARAAAAANTPAAGNATQAARPAGATNAAPAARAAAPATTTTISPATAQPARASGNTAPASGAQPAHAPVPAAAATANAAAAAHPALPNGQQPYIVTFITRPSGATVTVRDQTIVAPGDMNLGAMPLHVLVTAQKEGFQSSSVWLERVEFVPSSDGLRRRVYLTLPPLPAGASKPASAPANAAKPN